MKLRPKKSAKNSVSTELPAKLMSLFMKTKKLLQGSLALLALGVLTACQAGQPQNSETQQGPAPTGQSTSTVMITNQTGLVGTAVSQEELMKPSDISKADQDAFMKADAAKDPRLCDAITSPDYKKFCLEQAGDKNSQPLQSVASTQEKCQSTSETNGVKNCINYEE
jgi:hypothetical protein